MYNEGGIRGDRFIDRLGGWTEVLLACASLGIVLSRFRKDGHSSDVALLILYALEIAGALLITKSQLRLMQVAFWIFVLRVLAGVAYMSVIHGDALARSTLGFPFVVALYCWVRVRALRHEAQSPG